MIVPDLSLLIYAYNEGNEFHQGAQTWWHELLNGTETVGMPWQVSDGFIRQMANPSILAEPWTPAESTREVALWFSNDNFIALSLGPHYLEILERILTNAGATTRLVPDATIAALALENGAEVHTHNARDFQRFPGLMWRNPLPIDHTKRR